MVKQEHFGELVEQGEALWLVNTQEGRAGERGREGAWRGWDSGFLCSPRKFEDRKDRVGTGDWEKHSS